MIIPFYKRIKKASPLGEAPAKQVMRGNLGVKLRFNTATFQEKTVIQPKLYIKILGQKSSKTRRTTGETRCQSPLGDEKQARLGVPEATPGGYLTIVKG